MDNMQETEKQANNISDRRINNRTDDKTKKTKWMQVTRTESIAKAKPLHSR